MPLWQINHNPNILSDEDKQALAQKITDLYVKYGLPAFYVHVQFFEVPDTSFFIGGKTDRKHVTLTIYHLARTMTSDAHVQRYLADVDAILTPTFEPKGVDWEYFVTETPRHMWKINGLVPPQPGSDEEKEWVRLNRAVKVKL